MHPGEDTHSRQALCAGVHAGARYRLLPPRETLRGTGGRVASPLAGPSVDFKDYREYDPGDDLRHLDWSVYARSDRQVVKRFREEVTPQLDLLLDGTPSMALPGTAKGQAATALTALLATAAGNSACGCSTWISRRGFERLAADRLPPVAWECPRYDAPHHPAAAWTVLAPACHRNSMRIFISDLIWPDDPEPFVQALADRAASLTVIQLLAEEEAVPTNQGALRLADVESRGELELVVDAAVCVRYGQALAVHQENWSRACRRVGARLVVVPAEPFVATWRLPALEQLQILGAT